MNNKGFMIITIVLFLLVDVIFSVIVIYNGADDVNESAVKQSLLWEKECISRTSQMLKYKYDVSVEKALKNPEKVVPIKRTCKKVALRNFLTKIKTTMYVGVIYNPDKKNVSVIKTHEVIKKEQTWISVPFLIAVLSMVAFRVSFTKGEDDYHENAMWFLYASFIAIIVTLFIFLNTGIESVVPLILFMIMGLIFFIPITLDSKWEHRRIRNINSAKAISTASVVLMFSVMVFAYF